MSRSAPDIAAARDRSDLAGQFILCRSEALAPSGWPSRRLRGWVLAAHPRLPMVDIVDASGAAVGWLAGHAVDEAGAMVADRFVVRDSANTRALEDELYRIGGHFVAIVLAAAHERVYLDPAGALSCVYAATLQAVCATPSLIPYGMGCDDDDELIRQSGVPYRRALLGFGLTPRRGVERILPNHYLDLGAWTTHRHWPPAPIAGSGDPVDAVHTVARVLERHTRALAAGPAYLALTAGYDSRSVLACAREHRDAIELFTLAIPDESGALDVEVARRLARRFGLRHRVIPYQRPTPAQRDAWVWRTGFAVYEPRGVDATGMYSRLDPGRPEVAGVAGEAARAAYWRELGAGAAVTAQQLLAVMNLPATERLVTRARAWLDGLPAERPMQVVDLFYLEQRLGSWGGVLPYAEAHATAFRFYPFVHRDAFAAMLSLPDDYKLAARFPLDLIRARWPELADIPFNRGSSVRHHARSLRRRIWRLRRALAPPRES